MYRGRARPLTGQRIEKVKFRSELSSKNLHYANFSVSSTQPKLKSLTFLYFLPHSRILWPLLILTVLLYGIIAWIVLKDNGADGNGGNQKSASDLHLTLTLSLTLLLILTLLLTSEP